MKIAILGGSFDPPHQGHIHISNQAIAKFNLDEVWWLVAKQNPLKKNQSFYSFDQRIALAKDFSKENPNILVKNDEKEVSSNFTIDILKEIIQKYPKNEFFFLMGADNLINFHKWKNWQEILELVSLIICNRDDYADAALASEAFKYASKNDKAHFIKCQKMNISSTQIRQENYNFLVDSHCHLDLISEKNIDIDEVVSQAEMHNVKIMQTICTKVTKFDQIYQYTQKYPNIYASIGIHPCNVLEEPEITSEELLKIIKKHPKIIGIGETGLDYFHEPFDKEKQIKSFKEHIKASRESNLPLIIHSRNADEDMLQILEKEMKIGKFKALLHCFSSGEKLALRAIDLGVYISLSGILTFKNAQELQEIVKKLPLEYLLVETDAPYLAPNPFRGKLNQPAYTKHTAQFLAQLKNLTFEEICQITTKNFLRIFENIKMDI